jgi:hypothetical protein
MPTQTPKKSTNTDVVIVKKMRDYSKEPAIIKKADEMKAFLKKNGAPKFLSKDK